MLPDDLSTNNCASNHDSIPRRNIDIWQSWSWFYIVTTLNWCVQHGLLLFWRIHHGKNISLVLHMFGADDLGVLLCHRAFVELGKWGGHKADSHFGDLKTWVKHDEFHPRFLEGVVDCSCFCGNANERFLVTRWRQNGQQICKQLMLGHMFIFQVPTCFLGPFLVHFHVGLPGLCHTNAQRLSHLLRWCHTPFAWRWRQMVDVGFGG